MGPDIRRRGGPGATVTDRARRPVARSTPPKGEAMETAIQMLQVTCQEKNRPDTFAAEVASDCTGQEILLGLVEAGYLAAPGPNRSYRLTNGRTGTEIERNTTLNQGDVRDGEV